MPKTWDDVVHQLGWSGISVNQADPSIEAGAFYMARLRREWKSPRPALDRHQLAEASYNAGLGSLLSAQRSCGGRSLYREIIRCLQLVTGLSAAQTVTYVERIDTWRGQLGR
jgi:membrane-bound lytic murein transglycosylase F